MAEKKSTGKQNAPKKQSKSSADKNIVANPPQPMSEKESNIDLGGFRLSPTTVTVIVTALLFMIGWSYVSNWYAYFGLSADEINISLQQMLVFSTTPLIYTVGYFVTGSIIYLLFVKSIFMRAKLNSFSSDDWFWCILISIGILLINLFLIWRELDYTFEQYPNEINYLFIIGVALISTVTFSFFNENMALVGSQNPNTFRKTKDFLIDPNFITRLQWLLTTLLLFTALLSFSSSLALRDAAMGKRGIGGHVQIVFLVGKGNIDALQSLEVSCSNGCMYGPFGLVAERDSAFYLVVSQSDVNNQVSLTPGIYIVPRSDQNGPYFIVPAATSTVTPAVTITPTPAIAVTTIPTQP